MNLKYFHTSNSKSTLTEQLSLPFPFSGDAKPISCQFTTSLAVGVSETKYKGR